MGYVNIHKAVQYAQLDLLLELDRLCRENNLSYILVGGSMIGAVRHHGFIPWDDDVDVGMIREDYDRFLELCKSDLDPEYFYVDWKSDTHFPYAFAKLKIKNTLYVEAESENTGMDHCVFIDIFPYDAVPIKTVQKKRQALDLAIYKKLIQLRLGWDLGINKGVLKKLTYSLLRIVSYLKSAEQWKVSLIKAVSRYSASKTDNVVSLSGDYGYERETMPRALFKERVEIDFEGYQVFIPKDYDLYLHRIYGDYMQLPPIENRKSKHLVKEIDLGNYRIRNMHSVEVE